MDTKKIKELSKVIEKISVDVNYIEDNYLTLEEIYNLCITDDAKKMVFKIASDSLINNYPITIFSEKNNNKFDIECESDLCSDFSLYAFPITESADTDIIYSPLHPLYSNLFGSYEWHKMELTNGNILIITVEREEEIFFIQHTFKDLSDGLIENINIDFSDSDFNINALIID